VYTTSATKLLYVHRTHFHAFMRLVKDFEARVKRIAALRRKGNELTMQIDRKKQLRAAGQSIIAAARAQRAAVAKPGLAAPLTAQEKARQLADATQQGEPGRGRRARSPTHALQLPMPTEPNSSSQTR
jgi:hypothetical protein